MLKIGFPDDESEHEALALQRWGGDGAVRLLRADPHRQAMLLERLSAVDLTSVDDARGLRGGGRAATRASTCRRRRGCAR